MHKSHRRQAPVNIPLLLLFFLCLFLAASPLSAQSVAHKDVLILHSYHPGLPWTDKVMQGMGEVLGGPGNQIHVHVEYLDTLRYTDSGYTEHILGSIFHYKLEGQKFDLVLLSDNPALSFALEYRDDFFLDTPLVFCGINNFHPSMIAGSEQVTGVAEYPSYQETIETALKIHPDTAEIVVIGGTSNITSRENRNMLQTVLKDNDFPARFTFWDDIALENLTARLAKLPARTLVLINGAVALRSGEILSFEEEIRLIRAACPRPIYSFWDFFLGEGIVGGKLVSGREHGRIAAQMALRVLSGEDPDRIPVVAESNLFMFDHHELERFSIPLRLLPPQSVVINKPPPFYALSQESLWALVLTMSGLTLVLVTCVLLLRRAKAAMKREKERVDLLLNSTAEAIYGLDPRGLCIFCNRAALRLLGYQDERQLLGKEVHSIIHHTSADGTSHSLDKCQIAEALKKDVSVHGEDEVFWRADGTSFPIEYWSHPIFKGGEKIGALVTFLDISGRKRAEAERERVLQQLNAFVYTVSHDLRAPLTAIIGFSEFLLKHQRPENLDDSARAALEEIYKQAERMSSMMEDLLELAQVGKLPRPAEAVDTEALVREVLQELEHQREESGLSIRTEPIPPVRIPTTFLVQIFSNLVGNALRYAGEQGGPIVIGGRRTKGKVRFFVRDHGPGVPIGERERIFEVFSRGSTGKKVSGTGIGLATVRKITQFYAGDTWIEETPGGGATFWVELDDRGGHGQ